MPIVLFSLLFRFDDQEDNIKDYIKQGKCRMTIINQDNFPFVETNLLGLVPAEAFEVEIVRYLLGTVQKKTTKFPQIAMISVPGKFLSWIQLNLFLENYPVYARTITKTIGLRAGLKEVYLIPEPSAAILWSMITEEDYQMEEEINNREYQELHHIIDLGAGTMDITSVLKVVKTDYNDGLHVFIHGVNCSGDNFLGGEDIDSLLLEHLIYPKVLDDLACDLMDERNKVPQSILKELVREAKERLSIEENDLVGDYNAAILSN